MQNCKYIHKDIYKKKTRKKMVLHWIMALQNAICTSTYFSFFLKKHPYVGELWSDKLKLDAHENATKPF